MITYNVLAILRPTVARLKKIDHETGDTFSMLFAALPVDERRTDVYILVSRNYAFELPDSHFQEFQELIVNQDKAIVESQKPEELPLDLQAELHLKADRLSIAYRKWLKELGVSFGTA
ncbi:hypothetical protein [Cohnella luojiensis]|uniref:hypothetical protein n=1 Tax=Cohnella luojiensis TaxID=652876 RepID=UPI001F0F6B64|nr:hypothetical protein [Cohnella luojiensis]